MQNHSKHGALRMEAMHGPEGEAWLLVSIRGEEKIRIHRNAGAGSWSILAHQINQWNQKFFRFPSRHSTD